MDAKKQFQAWLIKHRKDAKLGYRALAEKSGVNVATIHEIERSDSDPRLSTVNKLCEAFGTSMEAAFRVRSKKEANHEV